MSVIIRLQNLAWSAASRDIRAFFKVSRALTFAPVALCGYAFYELHWIKRQLHRLAKMVLFLTIKAHVTKGVKSCRYGSEVTVNIKTSLLPTPSCFIFTHFTGFGDSRWRSSYRGRRQWRCLHRFRHRRRRQTRHANVRQGAAWKTRQVSSMTIV